MQLQSHKSINAYTLIELLVSITIIIIIFSIGFAGFRDFSRRQMLAGVAKIVKANLRLAQQMASSGQKPSGCGRLDGYTVTFSSNSYSLIANCTDPTNDITYKTVDLSANGITLSSFSVMYKVLGQGTNLSADLTLTLTHTATGKTATILIGKGGGVN